MKEIEGKLSAKGLKIALVASRFNSFLVEQLVKGAADAFNRLGGDAAGLVLVRVPGAYEIPVTAKKLAASKKFDAVVGLGAVVQGATAHAALMRGERREPRAGGRALRHEAGQQGLRGDAGGDRARERPEADLRKTQKQRRKVKWQLRKLRS